MTMRHGENRNVRLNKRPGGGNNDGLIRTKRLIMIEKIIAIAWRPILTRLRTRIWMHRYSGTSKRGIKLSMLAGRSVPAALPCFGKNKDAALLMNSRTT